MLSSSWSLYILSLFCVCLDTTVLCEERKKRVSVLTQYVHLDTVGGKEIVWRIEDMSVYSVPVSVGS